MELKKKSYVKIRNEWNYVTFYTRVFIVMKDKMVNFVTILLK